MFSKPIHQQLSIKSVFSHQETGLQITFNRDKSLKFLFKSLSIQWKEFVNNGVIRGLQNRKTWINSWENFMSQDPLPFSASQGQFVNQNQINSLKGQFSLVNLSTERNLNFQKGGRPTALRYLKGFLEDRYPNYQKIFLNRYWQGNPAVDYLLTLHGESYL